MRQLMKSQLKNVPEADQERLLLMVEENPDLFGKMAEDIQKKMKEGKSQMTAAMEVARENEASLRKAMGQ